MKRGIITVFALLLFARASQAAEVRLPASLGRLLNAALAPLDLVGGNGLARLSGSAAVTPSGSRRGRYRPPEHGRSHRRQYSDRRQFRRGRPHLHGSFWRWLFGLSCWCQRQASPGRSHGGRPGGGRR